LGEMRPTDFLLQRHLLTSNNCEGDSHFTLGNNIIIVSIIMCTVVMNP